MANLIRRFSAAWQHCSGVPLRNFHESSRPRVHTFDCVPFLYSAYRGAMRTPHRVISERGPIVRGRLVSFVLLRVSVCLHTHLSAVSGVGEIVAQFQIPRNWRRPRRRRRRPESTLCARTRAHARTEK